MVCPHPLLSKGRCAQAAAVAWLMAVASCKDRVIWARLNALASTLQAFEHWR